MFEILVSCPIRKSARSVGLHRVPWIDWCDGLFQRPMNLVKQVRRLNLGDLWRMLREIRGCGVQIHQRSECDAVDASPTDVGNIYSFRVFQEQIFSKGGGDVQWAPQLCQMVTISRCECSRNLKEGGSFLLRGGGDAAGREEFCPGTQVVRDGLR